MKVSVLKLLAGEGSKNQANLDRGERLWIFSLKENRAICRHSLANFLI
jgi:hypothetical protein